MKAALWVRVSTGEQDVENQLRQLRDFVQRRGFDVARIFHVRGESAWKGEQQRALEEVLVDARAGTFEVMVVWSLDRLERRGPLAVLQLLDRLARAGVRVVSVQEEWVEGASGELRDLLVSIVAWVGRWESQRRSERTKAGLVRAVAEGKRLGRPPGSKDRRRRRRSGYFARWAERAAG